MAKVINKGWSKPGDEIPQPVGVVLKPKIQHGVTSQGKYPVLSPEEARELGIDTSPVFVISPTPRATPTEQPTPGKATNPKER